MTDEQLDALYRADGIPDSSRSPCWICGSTLHVSTSCLSCQQTTHQLHEAVWRANNRWQFAAGFVVGALMMAVAIFLA